jgi:acyl-CoA dehydrogenase
MLAKTEGKSAAASWPERARGIADEIASYAAAHDAADSFVENGFARLKSEGFFKALVPVELGGGGASTAEVCESIRILGRACGSTALAFSMHCHLVAVAAWRREHQNAPTEGMLKRVAAEDLVLVSTGGNDWLDSGGSAEKVDGGFRVTARKPFASGSPMGDLLNTSARYDDPETGPTVLHFAVPLTAEGVRIEPTWRAMGMRGTGSNDVVLDGVFVPDAGIAGRRPAGEWHMLFHVIAKMAFAFIYSAYLGVAEGARDLAIGSAAKRAPGPSTAARRRAGERATAGQPGQRACHRDRRTVGAGPRHDQRGHAMPPADRSSCDRRGDKGAGACRRFGLLPQECPRAHVPRHSGGALPPAAGKAAARAHGPGGSRLACRRLRFDQPARQAAVRLSRAGRPFFVSVIDAP